MSDKIVVYSNDLNQISLGSLKEQEQNLFFSILVKLKDKGHEPVFFDTTELNNMLSKHYTESQLTAFVKGLKDHFFKLDFRTEERLSNGDIVEDNTNLFKYMRIRYNEDRTVIKELEIEVNERFEYMLNQLKANFTAFELANFLVLNSKYSKTLFRLLKQYRTQGWWQVELKEFKRLLQVPKTYQMTHIDNKIIKPSIKELTWDNGQTDMLTDYRGAERPCFKNLSVEKIKGMGRGRGGAVVALKFTWEPELVEKKQITQSQEVQQPQIDQDKPIEQPQFDNPFLNSKGLENVEKYNQMSDEEFMDYYCKNITDSRKRQALTDSLTFHCSHQGFFERFTEYQKTLKEIEQKHNAEQRRESFNNSLSASLKTKPKK